MHEGDHSILEPHHDHNAHPRQQAHKHTDGATHAHEARKGLAPRLVAVLIIGAAVAAFVIARLF